MDIGLNTELKVKLTPKDDKAVISHNLLISFHLKENLFVAVALMHKTACFEVRKSHFCIEKTNGKIRLLVDLRKINTLIAYDYTDINHLVSR